MGVDTDSKEFKTFEAGLKDNENFNSKYVKDFLENAPELTVEKRQEIDKQRDIDLQKRKKTAANNYLSIVFSCDFFLLNFLFFTNR